MVDCTDIINFIGRIKLDIDSSFLALCVDSTYTQYQIFTLGERYRVCPAHVVLNAYNNALPMMDFAAHINTFHRFVQLYSKRRLPYSNLEIVERRYSRQSLFLPKLAHLKTKCTY